MLSIGGEARGVNVGSMTLELTGNNWETIVNRLFKNTAEGLVCFQGLGIRPLVSSQGYVQCIRIQVLTGQLFGNKRQPPCLGDVRLALGNGSLAEGIISGINGLSLFGLGQAIRALGHFGLAGGLFFGLDRTDLLDLGQAVGAYCLCSFLLSFC